MWTVLPLDSPLLTVGLKVPVEGSWIIVTEAAGVFIVKRPLHRSVAYQVSFNLGGGGGREEPVLVWGVGKEEADERGPTRARTVTSSVGKEQGRGGQGHGVSTFVSLVSGAEV